MLLWPNRTSYQCAWTLNLFLSGFISSLPQLAWEKRLVVVVVVDLIGLFWNNSQYQKKTLLLNNMILIFVRFFHCFNLILLLLGDQRILVGGCNRHRWSYSRGCVTSFFFGGLTCTFVIVPFSDIITFKDKNRIFFICGWNILKLSDLMLWLSVFNQLILPTIKETMGG